MCYTDIPRIDICLNVYARLCQRKRMALFYSLRSCNLILLHIFYINGWLNLSVEDEDGLFPFFGLFCNLWHLYLFVQFYYSQQANSLDIKGNICSVNWNVVFFVPHVCQKLLSTIWRVKKINCLLTSGELSNIIPQEFLRFQIWR